MRTLRRIKTIWACRKEIILDYKIRIDLIAFQKEWRKLNCHNGTIAGCKFDSRKVKVGYGTYGTLNIHCWDNSNESIEIGNYCSIAEDVNFLLGGEHPIHRLSTFPFKSHVFQVETNSNTGTKGPIIVEDDVWICYGATVLSGVRIGKGSIIGAKSVVAKDVPPYAIVVNNRIIGYRFSDSVISKILTIDLKKMIEESNKDVIVPLLDMELTDDNVDDFVSKIV